MTCKRLRQATVAAVAVPLAVALCIGAAVATAQSGGQDSGGVAASLFMGPASMFIFMVELSLGIGLGYVSLKALKYILAFAALMILGVLLNVWQAPQLAFQMGIRDFIAVSSQVLTFAYSIGLTTVLPLTVGFISGAIIGALK
jgi:hypothetical protein